MNTDPAGLAVSDVMMTVESEKASEEPEPEEDPSKEDARRTDVLFSQVPAMVKSAKASQVPAMGRNVRDRRALGWEKNAVGEAKDVMVDAEADIFWKITGRNARWLIEENRENERENSILRSKERTCFVD